MLKSLAVVGSTVLLALLAAAPIDAHAPGPHALVQKVGITIGSGDRLVEANIALAPGVPVRLTVTNETREFHTFTVPALGVTRLVYPADGHGPRRTTFTFTPDRWGSFAWHCLICPTRAHGQPHEMGGTLYLIVDASALTS